MLRNILRGALVMLAGSAALAYAGPKEDVQAAAKKLGESDNYSWKSTVEGGFGAGATEGKTQKDGLTTLSVTMRDTTVEVVIKGNKGAVKGEDGWKSVAEAADQQGPQRFLSRMVQNFKAPAAQAEDLAGKAKELEKADGAIAGELTEEGAKSLMTFGRRADANAPQVSKAKGSVKFWTADGMLSKMEFNVQGTITINNEDRDINRTTTVEIKEVGTTKVDAPAEAKEKLK